MSCKSPQINYGSKERKTAIVLRTDHRLTARIYTTLASKRGHPLLHSNINNTIVTEKWIDACQDNPAAPRLYGLSPTSLDCDIFYLCYSYLFCFVLFSAQI